MWLGQTQWNNTLLKCTSHQGKVTYDHSHADRSVLIFIHLSPLPAPCLCCCIWRLAFIHSQHLGSHFFKEHVYICCLRDKIRAVPTLLKIDYMDYFVCINNSVIPPQKVNLKLQKRDGVESSEEIRLDLFGDESTGNVTEDCETVV